MAAWSRGNGTNFDLLRKSCDISTCDLSPDGNLEKYIKPMKSAIESDLTKRLVWVCNDRKVRQTTKQGRSRSSTTPK